jgi:peptidyl-dipeptidase Dcp
MAADLAADLAARRRDNRRNGTRMTEKAALASLAPDNPFHGAWETPFGLPPFATIRPEHFRPAFETALADHRAEIDAITNNPDEATFANTVEALEGAGRGLDRVAGVFYNLAGADTNEALQAIEREMAPLMSRHASAIRMNGALFARVDALFERRESLGLDSEQLRLLEKTHRGFVRSGAKLGEAGKARLAAINERLAELGTRFSQNVLKDEASYAKLLDDGPDLDGLPGSLVAAMGKAAEDRGAPGRYAVTLSRSIIEPFLAFSTRRALREEVFRAWVSRGECEGETDNRAIVAETLRLRAEKAKLLGFPSFAAYKLDDTMAKTPDKVRALLDMVWHPARERAARARHDMQALAAEEGVNDAIEPWDWRYYAEKVRRARFDLDEARIKPHFALDNVIAAAFDVAGRLFGLSFEERTDLPVYHPEVRAFEVTDRDGRHIGVFLGDYFARPSKRSGAWMSAYRSQEAFEDDIRPVIVNVMNFAKPAAGEPALLSLDDARTLFHEFGHGLHGLLSDVRYPSLSGTSVSRDFVELPSQLYEHWLTTPEVLDRFALNVETGEKLPGEMVERILASRTFNQGFATIEYTASAYVDLAFHTLDDAEGLDPIAFEREELARLGMPGGIVMRHRTPHFAHVFSGDGYSAGYYSYLWSEVMDADAFEAFREAGDVFHPETAERLARFVYAAGDSRDPELAYAAFRGRGPSPQALLEKRGLTG